MNKTVRNVALAITICAIGLASWRGSTVTFHDQWPLYEALRNTAAIIFAVIGAWLAIVYPERLRVSLRGTQTPPPKDAVTDGGRVLTLMAPIVHSTFILAAVLAVGIVAPLIKELQFVRANVEIFRGASYGILTSLTLWQLWTVVLTLVPASEVTNKINHEVAVKHTVGSVLSSTRKPEKKR